MTVTMKKPKNGKACRETKQEWWRVATLKAIQ